LRFSFFRRDPISVESEPEDDVELVIEDNLKCDKCQADTNLPKSMTELDSTGSPQYPLFQFYANTKLLFKFQ
jgi:hypothetical protein